LSRTNGARAKNTLCFPARSWWNDPWDALSKEKRSWSLFSASLLYILVLLVVSPLSAGLLAPVSAQIPTPVDFVRAVLPDRLSWQLDTEDLIIFRTISAAILDRSTSAWLSKDSAVLPFWPLREPSAPLGSSFATDSQPKQWKAQTVVYNMELECSEMTLSYQYNATQNRTVHHSTLLVNESADFTFLVLHSDDNCVITLADYADSRDSHTNWMESGGGWWSGSDSNYSSSALSGMSNSTQECGDRSMFFINKARRQSDPFQLEAHVCSERFYSASVSATVSINQSSTVVAFDPNDYSLKRVLLDQKTFNITQLRASFLSSNWTSHFLRLSGTNLFAGPLMALAAGTAYNNDPDKLLASPNLKQQASKLYQQFFGEMLLQALKSGLQSETISGLNVRYKQRILVSTSIGITLASLLLISAGCIAIVTYLTRLNRRRLNLVQDPGTIAAVASLLSSQQQSRSVFEGADCVSQKALTKMLGESTFLLNQGKLVMVDSEGNNHRTGKSYSRCSALLDSEWSSQAHSIWSRKGKIRDLPLFEDRLVHCFYYSLLHSSPLLPCYTSFLALPAYTSRRLCSGSILTSLTIRPT